MVYLTNWSVFSESDLTWADVGHKVLAVAGLTRDDSIVGQRLLCVRRLRGSCSQTLMEG